MGMNPWTLFYRLANMVRRGLWLITAPITTGVRVLLVRDGQVLLVKHVYQEGWFLPGGGVKRGETLDQAARREAAEEVGAQMGEMVFFGMYTNFYDRVTDHIAVFACTDFTLSGRTDHEIERCTFFPFDSLPAEISPGHDRRVAEYARGQPCPVAGHW